MTAPKVLVVGASSFLATAFAKAASGFVELTAIRRPDRAEIERIGADVVVNFSCNPAYFQDGYASEIDADRAVAEAVADTDGHFFMLSTRMVYGPSAGRAFEETQDKRPATPYATNKSKTEDIVIRRMGDRATILRLANIFGMEYGRRTFAGQALTSLHDEARIVLDISTETTRDFLPCEIFGRILTELVQCPQGSVLNLGSGISTKVGDMGRWFIEGFGRGRLESTSEEQRDEFSMNIEKLRSIISSVAAPGAVREGAIAAGRELRRA